MYGFPLATVFLCMMISLYSAPVAAADVVPMQAEILDSTSIGPSMVEGMEDVRARDQAQGSSALTSRQGRQGVWVIPDPTERSFPASGTGCAINRWGDTIMEIGIPGGAHVHEFMIAGHGPSAQWARAVLVIGYQGEQEMGRSSWVTNITATPQRVGLGFTHVDRLEFHARPTPEGTGAFAIDDLKLTPALPGSGSPIVITFDDLDAKTVLTGSDYAGLTWELGKAAFGSDNAVPLAESPAGYFEGTGSNALVSGGTAQLPQIDQAFQGVIRGDAGSFSYPPDTMGAIGPDHFVVTVNRVFAVYDRASGNSLLSVQLGSFLPGSNGDPRVLFDHHSGRWVVIVSDFSSKLYLAVSLSSDAMGSWFKTSFVASQGTDAGKFPDYPTLGVDTQGIYTSAYMVPTGMSIFAIPKAPLLTASPVLNTVAAFRNFAFEGAIQPVHTYGDPGGELLVSRVSATSLRLRRIDPPLTAPTLIDLGLIAVPSHAPPLDAPALGSAIPIDTLDTRLIMAVYRDGSLWTAHTIDNMGRAACRWYELSPMTMSLLQHGTVADPSLHYYIPSIMVNRNHHVVMAFSGSNENQFVGAYYTGRHAGDPTGAMGTPLQLHAGQAPQNNIDGAGRNRWGDYTYTTLDPLNEDTIWTIQEYAHAENIWGTWVASFRFDCNENGVDDAQDVASGNSADCNVNGIPDECDPQVDCNANMIQDICDVGSGTSTDCENDSIPDECQPSSDCNNDGILDHCQIGTGGVADCNLNGIPDACDLSSGISVDCEGDGVPDSCQSDADCDTNGVRDSCDLASGAASDCNGNGVPDGCDIYDCGPPNGCTGDASCCSSHPGVGCNCPRCCQSVCSGDSFCCAVQWDSICASLAINNSNCDCGAHNYSHDCNHNQIPDECDIASGTSEDCNGNGVPDECDANLDCNNNGIQDTCDVASGEPDCNTNEVPDTCESPLDCNSNGVQDICDLASGTDTDCNANSVLDGCDIEVGQSNDCNQNNLPDECESPIDCNSNGLLDFCEIFTGVSPDCNGNDVPDECDIYECGLPSLGCSTGDCCATTGHAGTGCQCPRCCNAVCAFDSYCCAVQWDSFCAFIAFFIDDCDCGGPSQPWSRDCNENTIPDECDIATGTSGDCEGDGIPDECESPDDCNSNGVQDFCDVAVGTSADCNTNIVPDECESSADCNANDIQDICDVASGFSSDCNGNEIPDDCETANGSSPDCNGNGIPDSCEIAAPTARNFCGDALEICPDLIYSGTTVGSTNDGQASCGESSTSRDVWFKYVPASNGAVTVSLCNSVFDTVLSVHSACPGNVSSQIVCNDDSCGLRSIVNFNATAGEDYLIRIAGFSGSAGTFTLQLSGPACLTGVPDCNGNQVPDECDVAEGALDCNGNLIPDACDVVNGLGEDCNLNGILDECDVASGTSGDCNGNGRPDMCDTTPFETRSTYLTPIYAGISQSYRFEQPPMAAGSVRIGVVAMAIIDDSAEFITVALSGLGAGVVFNEPGWLSCATDQEDSIFLTGLDFNNRTAVGYAEFDLFKSGTVGASCPTSFAQIILDYPLEWDCNHNNVLDSCDLTSGFSADCNDNGRPDECEPLDCNDNIVPDECEPNLDCNGNGTQDICDAASGGSADCNQNEIPDECEPNADGDAAIDACDPCPFDPEDDRDGDGTCDSNDQCPDDPNKILLGQCGCGIVDVDSDSDLVADCVDLCPGADDRIFGPECDGAIPTTSTWGLIMLTLMLLCLAKAIFDSKTSKGL